MSLLLKSSSRSSRRLPQILLLLPSSSSRRLSLSKNLQYSPAQGAETEPGDNTTRIFIQVRQIAELDLQRAVKVIEISLSQIERRMPAGSDNSREVENSGEVPSVPELIEDSKLTSPVKPPCRWVPTSAALLEQAEKRILACLKTPYTARYVNIGPVVSTKGDDEIWTVSLNEQSKKLPLVLLHGFGAGIGFWSLNLDSFAKDRPVYAIDHLGFGRSSRPKFNKDPAKAEKQFIDAIEAWRQKVNLDKFVLVGHSFGGYLAMSYAITYPNSVAHLVLADPWGLPEKPDKVVRQIPWYIKTLAYLLGSMNPFWAIRAAGPKGPGLLERVRPDLVNKFSELNEINGDVKFGEYVYHCNAQEPSGETAFHNLMHDFGWSKFPLIRRISDLSPKIDITALYGSQSWVSVIPAEEFPALRPESKVNVYSLQGAGHHVYSDAKDEFNSIINRVSSEAENKA